MYKKYIVALLSFAALYGCQKDSEPGGFAGDDKVVFAGASTAGGTRTSLGDTDLATIPVYWSPSDAIGVYAATAGAVADNARATITEGAGTQNGKFISLGVTMADAGNVFYLYYPHTKGANIAGEPDAANPVRFNADGEPSLTILLPSEQTQKQAGAYDQFGRYGFSVAKSAPADKGSEINFSMKHMLSYLELSLWNTDAGLEAYELGQIEIAVSDDKSLTGVFKTDFDGNYQEVAGGTASSKLTLSITNPANMAAGQAEAQKFLATILPTDLTGTKLTVSVTLTDNTSASPETITISKSFDGADFSGGILKKLNEDISTWERMMGMPASLEAFLDKIKDLEYWTTKWHTEDNPKPVTEAVEKSSYSGKYPQWLITSHMRQYGGYTSITWMLTGGSINDKFTTYLQTSDLTTFNNVKSVVSVPGLEDGAYSEFNFTTRTNDVRHMMATMSAVMYGSGGTLDDLAGWGGDLVTLVVHMLKYRDTSAGTGDEDFYAALTKQYVARPGTTYDMDDLIGDVDAINIPAIIKEQDCDMYTAMTYYYSSSHGSRKRFTRFYDYFGADETAFYNKTLEYTTGTQGLIKTLYTNNGFTVADLTEAQSKGIARGYCEFILSLIAAE